VNPDIALGVVEGILGTSVQSGDPGIFGRHLLPRQSPVWGSWAIIKEGGPRVNSKGSPGK
jgi:hypothetical protein